MTLSLVCISATNRRGKQIAENETIPPLLVHCKHSLSFNYNYSVGVMLLKNAVIMTLWLRAI